MVADPYSESITYQSVGYRYKLKDDNFTGGEDAIIIMQVKEQVDISVKDALFETGSDGIFQNQPAFKYPG